MHEGQLVVDEDLVRALVADQLPAYADQPVRTSTAHPDTGSPSNNAAPAAPVAGASTTRASSSAHRSSGRPLRSWPSRCRWPGVSR